MAQNTELYRRSTLGQTLEATLDEMVDSGEISPAVAMRAMEQFDESVGRVFAGRTRAQPNTPFRDQKTKITGSCKWYRSVEQVWTFVLKNATFRTPMPTGQTEHIVVPECKLVLTDGTKQPTQSAPAANPPAQGQAAQTSTQNAQQAVP